ncbi:MAG: DUF3737 family protein [Muribaculaceae bacterium]|nr:DUF3737 family protein [Muribaculaceae bacterium]
MNEIRNREFEGERPLFAAHDAVLDHVSIGKGESALKRCNNIVAKSCTFNGKYPFWHCNNFSVDNCNFNEGARAALWYSRKCMMKNCTIEAPKMFRMMMDIDIENTTFTNGQETLWDCSDIRIRNVKIENCDYLFMHSHNIDINHYKQHGNYTFQYCTNSIIRNAVIFSKDAFWNTSNLTIIDSKIHGEYLGWYSKDLTLINCHISGTQPLCYIDNLTMINCTMADDSDLAFEESKLNAEIASEIVSVKNPRKGIIKAKKIGEIIIDKNIIPDSDCKIIIQE